MAEVSIIRTQELRESERFDAEYFKLEYLEIEKELNKNNNSLKSLGVEIYHPNEIKREYVPQDGVLFVRAQNIRPLNFDLTNKVYISKFDADVLGKNIITKEDILMTRTGANFGQTCIFNYSEKAIASSHTFIIKSGRINPYLLAVFFNTHYGIKMIKKGMYGGLQPEISPKFLLKIPFPSYSNNFQILIEKIVKESYSLLELSKKLYNEADELLLNELDLVNYTPEQKLSFSVSSKKVFDAKRINSEYFQPKYDVIMEHIKNNKYRKLEHIVNIKKSIEPGSEAYQSKGIPFIRVSNLTKFGISKSNIYISEKYFIDEELKNLKPKQNTILLSKDGTVGIAYNVKGDSDFITSGALLHLTINNTYSHEVLPEYLTLVLNSKIVQMQSERDAGGSIIKHWKPSEIKAILIPIIDINTQHEIERKILKSFQLKDESSYLLEKSIKAVEMSIEYNENKAIDFLTEL